MRKFYNYLMALLLPTMVGCNGNKVQETPECMYGGPIPESEQYEDESAYIPKKYGCPMPPKKQDDAMNDADDPTQQPSE